MKHWTTEHYPDAEVPLDLWELIRALVTQHYDHLQPEDRLSQRTIVEYVDYLTEQEPSGKLDAYRIYRSILDSREITVGIRFGDAPSDVLTPYLSRVIADRFDLDPLNKDKPLNPEPLNQ